jgi:hypothetical protein
LNATNNALAVIAPTVLKLSFKEDNPYKHSRSSFEQNEDFTSRGNYFRANLLTHLGYTVEATSTRSSAVEVKCMVSGVVSSKEDSIRAAHIIPAVTPLETIRKLNLKVEDIDSVRNGLLLARNIERAFDNLDISFVRNPLVQMELVMKIWNPATFKDKPLFVGSQHFVSQFNGWKLNLDYQDESGRKHEPFLRGLAYQSFQAYLKWKFIVDIEEPHDYSSEQESNFAKNRRLNMQFEETRRAEQAESSPFLQNSDSGSVGDETTPRKRHRPNDDSDAPDE